MSAGDPEAVPRGPGRPTAPIDLEGGPAAARARTSTPTVDLPDDLVERLAAACDDVVVDEGVRAEASRDWWPLAMCWALDGQVGGLADVVVRPAWPAEVAEVLAVCDDAQVPVTAVAGRSGVCGGSVPVHGGVVVDLCGLDGIHDVDDTSLVADVGAGTFGDDLERRLQADHGLTLGHWPQSMTLSTVGGWLACRSAGQLSTRYGKIEDMVVGLDVALADGRLISTGGAPRAATGPDLTQLFVGSEGTLGIITGARLRLHPAPVAEVRAAWGFDRFDDGLDACRRILRRGATPAVLRLYDQVESERNFDAGDTCVLLVLDEGDEGLIEATLGTVREECAAADPLDDALLERWLEHRNDVSALEQLIAAGFVVDTMEIAARWSALPEIARTTIAAIDAVETTRSVSVHQSHAYPDGACLYFTFGGRPESDAKDAYYREVWDAGTAAVLAGGGALSHHHGIGLNRSRHLADALGDAHDVLASVKAALDPKGILNPGKLGLPSPFGAVAWP